MAELDYRLLGRSGLRVAEIALGTMTFGGDEQWGTDAAEARRIYEAYREVGGNYLDTANQYADGRSESIVGELVAGHREEVVIASKYSNSAPGFGANAGGNQRKNMVESVEATLRRLGTDHLDFYLAHVWDEVTPVDEVMRAFDDLVSAGKVLYIGMSNAPAWVVAKSNAMAELRGWSRYVGIQVEYSLLARDVEREIAPMAHHEGLSVLAWSPLKNGLLTGKYAGDQNTADSRLTSDLFRSGLLKDVVNAGERGDATVREVVAIAEEIGAGPAQVALAWLMQRPQSVIPIIGARTLRQLEHNLGAADVVLSPQHQERLDAVSAVRLGYPHDYLAGGLSRSFRSGGLSERIRR